MELFKIVKDNKKSLRQRSTDVVTPLNDEVKLLGHKMLEYLILSQDEKFLEKHKNVRSGVGLAAPQIGRNIKLIAVYFIDEDGKEFKHILVNPKIISESTKMCALRNGEGCLSVDKDHIGYVYRPYKVQVKAYDILLEDEITLSLEGYKSIVVQHEIDHLKGTLFYDHIDKKEPFKELPNSILIN